MISEDRVTCSTCKDKFDASCEGVTFHASGVKMCEDCYTCDTRGVISWLLGYLEVTAEEHEKCRQMYKDLERKHDDLVARIEGLLAELGQGL